MNILFDFLVRIEKLTGLFGWRREKMRGQNRLTYLVLPVEDQSFFPWNQEEEVEVGLFGESERVGVWTKQEGAFCHCELLPACINLID